MSSGDKAKPPASYEERNPFDISRRSGAEVASEIAKRMAAWKQARERSAAPAAPKAAPPPADAAQPPRLAAPVLPARAPKFGDRSAQPQPAADKPTARKPTQGKLTLGKLVTGKPVAGKSTAGRGHERASPQRTSNASGGSEGRVPYFASFSIKRAMPPAPSSKPDSAPAVVHGQRSDERIAVESPPITTAETPVESGPTAAETHSGPGPVHAPVAEIAVASMPTVSATAPRDPAEDGRSQAAIEASENDEPWIEMLTTDPDSGSAPPLEAAAQARTDDSHRLEPAGEEARNTDAAIASKPAETVTDSDEIEIRRAKARDLRARWIAAHDLDSPNLTEEAHREQPPVSEPQVKTDPAPPADAAEGHFEPAAPQAAPGILDLEASDTAAGRREPTFDVPFRETQPAGKAASRAEEAGSDPGHAADMPSDMPRGATLAAVPLRNEPVFARLVSPPAAQFDDSDEPKTDRATTNRAATHRATGRAAEIPPLEVLDEMAGRKEPTFEKPVASGRAAKTRPAAPSETGSPKQAQHIALPAIETRIEARRIELPLADAKAQAHRPRLQRIAPDEWDVPPAVAARSQRERRSTGWAIGLGAALLLVGITAPAAIWQQSRHGSPVDQDQVAMVNPAPASPQQWASLPTETQAAPAPAAAPAADGRNTATPDALSAPQLSEDQATLDAVVDGGELDRAPVVAPQAPSTAETDQPTSAALVAKPFVPDPALAATTSTSVLRPPTVGAASVSVNGASGTQTAALGDQPRLMALLKPKAPAVKSDAPAGTAQKQFARKPKPFFQQSPDQMFQTLIDTLANGQPSNEAAKPVPPSTRR